MQLTNCCWTGYGPVETTSARRTMQLCRFRGQLCPTSRLALKSWQRACRRANGDLRVTLGRRLLGLAVSGYMWTVEDWTPFNHPLHLMKIACDHSHLWTMSKGTPVRETLERRIPVYPLHYSIYIHYHTCIIKLYTLLSLYNTRSRIKRVCVIHACREGATIGTERVGTSMLSHSHK